MTPASEPAQTDDWKWPEGERVGGLGPLELDVVGFRRLPVEVRRDVDAWLKREGIKDAFYVKLGEGVVTVGRYLRNSEGKYYCANPEAPRGQWEPASEYVVLPVATVPPPEAFR